MKKSQLLSSAGLVLLLTLGTAHAQGNKNQHPQATQSQSPNYHFAASEKGRFSFGPLERSFYLVTFG